MAAAIIDNGARRADPVTGGGSFSGNISGANTALTVAGATQGVDSLRQRHLQRSDPINGGDTLKAGSTTALTGATSVTDNGTLDLNGNNLPIGAPQRPAALVLTAARRP